MIHNKHKIQDVGAAMQQKTARGYRSGSIRKWKNCAAKTSPAANTLSSLPACGPKEYSFCLPKNNLSTKKAGETIIIDGNLGDRKFVVINETKFLLVHQDTTEATVFYDSQQKRVRICSSIFPGKNGGQHLPQQKRITTNASSLFEWGVVRTKQNWWGSRGYTLATPHDGSYTMKHPKQPTKGRRYNPVTTIRSSSRKGSNGKKNSNICATLAEMHSCWKCRTIMGSIDPAMLACFALAIDLLQYPTNSEYENLVALVKDFIVTERISETKHDKPTRKSLETSARIETFL